MALVVAATCSITNDVSAAFSWLLVQTATLWQVLNGWAKIFTSVVAILGVHTFTFLLTAIQPLISGVIVFAVVYAARCTVCGEVETLAVVSRQHENVCLL